MEIGKTVEFINRDRHTIQITRVSELEFMMKGVDMNYMRTSVSNNGELIMFDPSGGPYTSAKYGEQPGTNMGYYHKDWDMFIVEKIEFQKDKPDVLLSCSYMKPIYWEKIK
jgi:hypothetical protein